MRPDPGFQLARYDVTEVVASEASRWTDGRLELDLAGLKDAVAGVSGALDDVSLRLVRPGDPVRVANVLDAVVPDVRADAPADTFPGALGGLSPAGRGRTHRLEGVHVLSVCDWLSAGYTTAEEFPDGLVDMGGPGQELTAFGTTVDLVAECRPREGAPVGDVDRAVRRVSLTLARELAGTTLGKTETRMGSFAAPPAAPELPGVVLVLQVASEGTLVDTFLYGEAVGGIVPTQVAPCEILDGALTSGAYDWAGVRNPTAFYQENAAIQDLFAAHGSRLRFLGVILALGYLDSVFAQRALRHAVRASRVGPRRGRGHLHHVLVGQLAHGHDAHRPRLRIAGRGDGGVGGRDQRWAHRSRPGGGLHREHRQRGRIGRRVAPRRGDRRAHPGARRGSRFRCAPTSARSARPATSIGRRCRR